MLGLYLFALVLGGGLLVLTLLGGDGESDVGADADIEVEVEADADPGGHHGGIGAGEIVLGLFRPRNLTFLLATFGATGTLLTLSGAGRLTTAVLAAAMGTVAMVLTHAVFFWIRRTESAVDLVGDVELEGSIGRVVLPLSPGTRGRVACRVGGRELYLTARLSADITDSVGVGREVVIVRTAEGEAEVIPSRGLELPPPTA